MRCPFAIWRPIPTNYGGHMGKVIGFVPHDQEGNGSLYGYFSNPASQVSSHFWCSKTGALEQYLDTDTQTAWAEEAGNPNYVSCEFEGFTTEPWTTAQLDIGGDLIFWLAGGYGFPMTGPVAHGSPGVTPHCNPDGTPDPAWGNHPCPGSTRLAQIPAMISAGVPPIPLPIKEETMAAIPLPNAQHPNRVLVTAVGAGSRADHLLSFTIDDPTDPKAPGYNVLDVTAGIGTANPYTVTSA